MLKRFITNTIKYPLVSVFAMFVVTFFASYLLIPQKDYSEAENRYLQIRPSVSVDSIIDGSYMNDFEEYTLSQLPIRDMFVRLKAGISQCLGLRENKGIVLGKNGQLVAKNMSVDSRLHKNIDLIAEFARSTDQNIYVAVAPTVEYVLEDELPAGMPYLDEKECERELDKKTKGLHNLEKVDITSSLLEHKDEYLYYKTDHHWTTEGAYLAYIQIAKALGKEPIDIEKLQKHEINGFYGTYFSKFKGFGIEPDTILYYDIPVGQLYCDEKQYESLYDISKADAYDKYSLFMRGNYGISKVTSSSVKDGSQLVVFKDSYANCLIPFLSSNYETIVVIDLRYFGENVADLLKEYKKADVLMLYNWLFLNEDNHFYKLIS